MALTLNPDSKYLETNKVQIALESLGESVTDFIVGTGDFFTVNREKEVRVLSDQFKFRFCNNDTLASIVAHGAYFASIFPKSGEAVGDAAYMVTQAKGSVQKVEAWGNLVVTGLGAATLVGSVVAPIATPKSPLGAASMPKTVLGQIRSVAEGAADTLANHTTGGGMGMVLAEGAVIADGTAVAGTATLAATGGWPLGLGAIVAMSNAAGEGKGDAAGATKAPPQLYVERTRLFESVDGRILSRNEVLEFLSSYYDLPIATVEAWAERTFKHYEGNQYCVLERWFEFSPGKNHTIDFGQVSYRPPTLPGRNGEWQSNIYSVVNNPDYHPAVLPSDPLKIVDVKRIRGACGGLVSCGGVL